VYFVEEKHVDGVTSGPSLAVVFSLRDESVTCFADSDGVINNLVKAGKAPRAQTNCFFEIYLTTTTKRKIRRNEVVGGYGVVLVELVRENIRSAVSLALHDVALTCIVEACAVWST